MTWELGGEETKEEPKEMGVEWEKGQGKEKEKGMRHQAIDKIRKEKAKV